MKSMTLDDAKANAHPYQAKDQIGLRAEAKQLVAEGFKVAANLPEPDGYKRWILDMARKVAETKTGGILGIGGKSVIDEKEQAALDELANIMSSWDYYFIEEGWSRVLIVNPWNDDFYFHLAW